MDSNLTDALISLAIREAPALIDRLREAFSRDNPDAPAPTDAEVIAAYRSAFESSLAKDDRWRAEHPG